MSGGVFLRFQVGSSGGSSGHLRYISRPAAVRDEKAGILLHNLPEAERETTFVLLRDHLIAYAWLREYAERRQGDGVRTFYHVVLGFESDIGSEAALTLVHEWLQKTFPYAEAAAFLHRDTKKLHAHVWMNARDTNGRKLQIGYRDFRSLDEVWNGIYSRVMGHAFDDHLAKKNETRWARRLSRPFPDRTNYTPDRDWYQRQELRNAGHDELKNELEKGGLGGIEPAITSRTLESAGREGVSLPGESAAGRSTQVAHETERTSERALRETHRLREDAQNLGSREKLENSKGVYEQER